MNKKALEKEAEEYANNLLFVYETETVQKIVRERVRLALIDVLERREKKQIQIDVEQIRALQKQNGELTDKVKELEQQIEKMKSDVISERDEVKRLEDVITYTVLNNILAKWGIKENAD